MTPHDTRADVRHQLFARISPFPDVSYKIDLDGFLLDMAKFICHMALPARERVDEA